LQTPPLLPEEVKAMVIHWSIVLLVSALGLL
jgi:hypothetical protein